MSTRKNTHVQQTRQAQAAPTPQNDEPVKRLLVASSALVQAVESKTITAADAWLLMTVDSLSSPSGWCTATNDELADRCGVVRRMTQYRITDLVERGFLRRTFSKTIKRDKVVNEVRYLKSAFSTEVTRG